MPWPNSPGWVGDLVAVLENPAAYGLQGDPAGVFGTDIFSSTKASPPLLPLPSGTLTIVETGGTSPQKTHNAVIRPAIVRPAAQLTARAQTYEAAKVKAHEAYDILVQVRNQFINSGWYLDIEPLQEPFDGGLDARSQPQCQFNVVGKVGTRPW